MTDLADDLAVLEAAGLSTSRYQSWTPEHGVPIRTSVGTPKFWRRDAELLVFVRALAPFGVYGKHLPPDEAQRRYVAKLNRMGDHLAGDLATVARRHPGRALCVLCFENVHAGQECHRRWFATWFESRYGIVVPEVIDPTPDPQLQLPL